MRETEILRIDVSVNKAQRMNDYVAEEKPLHLFLNKALYATILCSPLDMKELAIGHLLSEGIIKSVEEVRNVRLDEEKAACHVNLKPDADLERRLKLLQLHSRIIVSACGNDKPYEFSGKLSKVKSDLKVKAEVVLNAVRRLNSAAETYRKTGGVHAAALYDGDGTIIAFAEDVGRHNAVDKVIGKGAFAGADFDECFLALSGRLTGDMVLKAARVGLPVVASLAAAIDSGISVARDSGITLIGFVRGKRMNVYSLPQRILVV